MKILQNKLNQELENNLSFWQNRVVNSETNHIFSEVSIDGIPNASATTGAMYLSRILYGSSMACKLLETNTYSVLADNSYDRLKEFYNPKGGYYWSKDISNVLIHDADDTNMAQAFVLYGLVGYAQLKPSLEIDEVIENQFNFITNTLYDNENGGYIDGFDENWILGKNPTKALGTHLHLLEAFVKLYAYKKNSKVVPLIEELINIILQKFITKDSYDCLHRLAPDWKPLPNEVWAGHNAECSWILCSAAEAIQNKKLIAQCNDIALKMMQQVIEKAWDSKNGGIFNVLENSIPTEDVKIWWPQAETVIALLNCYKITKEKKYKIQAEELINYISHHFIAPNGEWYTQIKNSNQPDNSIPMVHFWKSMYHTVRYYDELKDRFQILIG